MYDIVFSISIMDFEAILGRKLSKDEIDIVLSKFTIFDWSETVEDFLITMGIKK